MKKIKRSMTNICSNQLGDSLYFYQTILDLKVNYESEWFVHLISDETGFELGIVDRTHDVVPKEFQNKLQGFYLTFVVDNVEDIFSIAKSRSFNIVSEPTNTFYGQRRLLLKDPDGALVDISSPIENFGQ